MYYCYLLGSQFSRDNLQSCVDVEIELLVTELLLTRVGES